MSLQGNIAVEVEMKRLREYIIIKGGQMSSEELVKEILKEIDYTIKAAESGWL